MTLLMADEREAKFIYYVGEVIWHDGYKRVRVLESENSYLASADLLAGSHIEIDMIPGVWSGSTRWTPADGASLPALPAVQVVLGRAETLQRQAVAQQVV